METSPIKRDQVVSELSRIADKGIRHPDKLNRSEPEVVKAQELSSHTLDNKKHEQEVLGRLRLNWNAA